MTRPLPPVGWLPCEDCDGAGDVPVVEVHQVRWGRWTYRTEAVPSATRCTTCRGGGGRLVTADVGADGPVEDRRGR